MDEKFVLTTVAERENGEMLGRVPGNLNSLFADAVEAGHLDTTTVLTKDGSGNYNIPMSQKTGLLILTP